MVVQRKFPPWIKKKLPATDSGRDVRQLLERLSLETVCQSAHCPNMCECFAKHTATFMIMGNICTRQCRFCAVMTGEIPPLDEKEPEHVAEAVKALGLRHAVITSVTRDDLPDGGSGHFARTIQAIRRTCECLLEVLTPDFEGCDDAIRVVVEAGPDIYNHNVETVPRLYSLVRPQADYQRSLQLIKRVKELDANVYTKSGLMVGLGELDEEVYDVLRDLHGVGCDIVTIGQYLRPSEEHLPVERFVHPEEFAHYEDAAREMGFAGVASGPFVRSSYNAGEVFDKTIRNVRRESAVSSVLVGEEVTR